MLSRPVTLGRYRLLERIGRGGMAEVFRAKSYGVEGFEKVVVIKRVLPELAARADFVELFLREARLALRLSHANVVQSFDLGVHEGAYYLAMEYVRGADLGWALSRLRSEKRQLSCVLAAYVAAEAAKGLDYAHRRRDEHGRLLGMVHRDISPQNLLLSFDGEVKVADFGVAYIASQSEGSPEDTQTRDLRGKFAYMSPEQARGDAVDARTDIFSLGVVLYECVTGVNPFASASVLETARRVLACEYPPPELLCPEVPPSLQQLLRTAMAPEPAQRFADAGKMHEHLLSFLYEQRRRCSADDLAEFLEPLQQPSDGEALRALLSDERTPPLRSARASASPPSLAPRDAAPRPSSWPAGSTRADLTVLALDWPDELQRMAGEPRVQQTLARYGGELLRGTGSLTWAAFGLRLRDGSDAEAAARCALALRRSDTSLGLGVHSAQVGLEADGTLRYDEALEAALDSARDLSRQSRTQVLASRAAQRGLPSSFVGEPPTPDGAVALRLPREAYAPRATLFGRREPLARFGEALALASRRRLRSIWLRGPQGVGKTALLHEIRRRAQRASEPVHVFVAPCLPQAKHIPYAGIACMLHVMLGLHDGDGAETVLATRPRLRALGLSEPQIAAVYGALGVHTVTAEVAEASLLESFAQMVRALAEDGVCVLAWDGAQSIDDESLQLLAALQASWPKARAVLVVASRSDAALPAWQPAERVLIELSDLGAEDARELVRDALEVRSVPAELSKFVLDRAGGHPLFLQELVRALLRARAVTVAEGQVVELRLGEVELQLPRTLRGLVSARLEALDAEARQVLQAMAVLGEPRPQRVLCQMLAIEPAQLAERLRELSAGELLYPAADETYAFRSPIVRDLLSELIGAELRQSLHRAAGEALQQSEFPVSASRVALHLHEAGESNLASMHFASSGEIELRHGHYEAALRAYAKALELADPEELQPAVLTAWLSALGEAAKVVRRLGALQLHDVLETLDARAELPLRVRGHLAACWVYDAQGRLVSARAAVERALQLAGADAELCELALAQAAELAALHGEVTRARALYAQLGAVAAHAPHAFKRAVTLSYLHAIHGERERAAALADDAQQLARGDALAEQQLHKVRGMLAFYDGDLPQASQAFERAAEHGRELGLTYEVAVNLHNLGDVWLRQGDRARAYGAFSQSHALAEEARHEPLRHHNRMQMGYLDALSDELEVQKRGRAQLEQSIEHARSREWVQDALSGRLLLAKVQLAHDEAGAATRGLEEVAREAERLGHLALAREARTLHGGA